MTAIVRNSFRVYNARKFISSLEAVNGSYTNSLYLGIGRPQTWDNENSDNPVSPGNNISDELTDWADLMFMKRIFASNVAHAIIKRVWAPNTYYDIYRPNWNGYSTDPTKNTMKSAISGETPTDLSKVKCYCISPQNIVYLCLDVAKDVNGAYMPSMIDPDSVANNVTNSAIPGTSFSTDLNTNIICCSDGYIWLKLANSTDLMAQFETIDYFPVQTVGDTPLGETSGVQLAWQTSAESHKGGIYSIEVAAKGSGYLSGSSGNFKITDAANGDHVKVVGDGSGLQYVVQFKSGTLDKIVVTNPGQGYTWAQVIVTSEAGTGAGAIANLTPMTGIAVDPVKTLNAYYVIVQTIIYDDENIGDDALNHGVDFTVDNDYRKVVLVSNPMTNSGNIAEAAKLDMTYGFVATTTNTQHGAIQPDMQMASNNSVAFVVDSGTTLSVGGNDVMRAIQVAPSKQSLTNLSTVAQNDRLTSDNKVFTQVGGSATYTTAAGATFLSPNAVLGSGDIIYADYRRPVSRAKKQSEELRILLEF